MQKVNSEPSVHYLDRRGRIELGSCISVCSISVPGGREQGE